ncbi:MAG: ferrochelatase, partial [Flavobacteriales bacterium]
ETTKAVVKYLSLQEGSYSNSFQSRLGNDPWLEPNTADIIDNFPKKGVKKLAVVTPAFVADCLETIEEIGLEAKQAFLDQGGEEFLRIECLNDDEAWAEVVARWAKEWQGISN